MSSSSTMDLLDMPFEIMEMILGNMSFIALPSFLRTSKASLVNNLEVFSGSG